MSGKLDKGLVEVYTGDGKGKTTAALGLAIRAVGRDLKVYIGQFMKTSDFGEHEALARFENEITLEQYGSGEFQFEETPSEEEIERAENGVKKIRKALLSGDYDIVIADEICVAYYFDLLDLEILIDLIDVKPENVELVLTGRKAPEELIDQSDLVSEIKEIKHPYRKGIGARKGIEK